MTYEQSFVGFIDFLGFSEATANLDDHTREGVLSLLKRLVSFRSESNTKVTRHDTDSSTYWLTPAVSTFSDNIVISYGLESIQVQTGVSEKEVPFLVFHEFQRICAVIAASALSYGFLIRGGATIGKLYHANGVVFGEALIEAVQLEQRTAVYPRVVASSAITKNNDWLTTSRMQRDDDGVYFVDYIAALLGNAAIPGDNWRADLKDWYVKADTTIRTNLVEHESKGQLNQLSKWAWFSRRFSTMIARQDPLMLNVLGVHSAKSPMQPKAAT